MKYVQSSRSSVSIVDSEQENVGWDSSPPLSFIESHKVVLDSTVFVLYSFGDQWPNRSTDGVSGIQSSVLNPIVTRPDFKQEAQT